MAKRSTSTALALPKLLDQLGATLAKAKTLEEVFTVRDHLAQLEMLAKVRARGTQLHADSWEMLQEAERRIGERTLELPKQAGGRPKLVARQQVSGPKPKHVVLAALGLPRPLVARCEKFAAKPRREWNDVLAKGRHLVSIGKRAPSLLSASAAVGYDGDEYCTPPREVGCVREVLERIGLDICSNDEAQKVIQAERYFTKQRSALDAKASWKAETAFYQPPYSEKLIAELTERFVRELDAGSIKAAISLTNADASTEWYQRLLERSSAYCNPYKRIAFLMGGAPQRGNQYSQTFCYFGPDVERFAGVFDQFGAVCKVLRPARPEARERRGKGKLVALPGKAA
jgi:hypothetical protein